MSTDTAVEPFVGIYYGLCHSHCFGSASPSGSQRSNRAIYAHQMPWGKASGWRTVKSSYLGTVESSNPAGEKVRQLLEGAGRAGGVTGTGKWPFSKTKPQFQSLHPAPWQGQGSTVCLFLSEISFFFLEKKLCLEGSHFSSAFRPSWVMGTVQLCYAKIWKWQVSHKLQWWKAIETCRICKWCPKWSGRYPGMLYNPLCFLTR